MFHSFCELYNDTYRKSTSIGEQSHKKKLTNNQEKLQNWKQTVSVYFLSCFFLTLKKLPRSDRMEFVTFWYSFCHFNVPEDWPEWSQ